MARLICSLAPDAAGDQIVDFIDGAEHRLDLVTFELGVGICEHLVRLHDRGVRLRVIVDASPTGNGEALAMLAAAGIGCRAVRLPDASGHGKLLVADFHRLALGTGELTALDLPQGRAARSRGGSGWWATVAEAPTIAEMARLHIGHIWDRAGAPLTLLGRELPTEHRPSVAERLPRMPALEIELPARRLRLANGGSSVAASARDLLAAATERAWLVVPELHPAAPRVHELIATLVGLGRRGGDARLLLGRLPAAGDIGTLAALGIPVRVVDERRSPAGHVRGLIADGAVVIASADWTDAGLGRNDETSLTVSDPEASSYFGDAYERDWASALTLDADMSVPLTD